MHRKILYSSHAKLVCQLRTMAVVEEVAWDYRHMPTMEYLVLDCH